jgi:hypothetical protein
MEGNLENTEQQLTPPPAVRATPLSRTPQRLITPVQETVDGWDHAEVTFRNTNEPSSVNKEDYIRRSARRVVVMEDGALVHDTTWAEQKLLSEKSRKQSGVEGVYQEILNSVAKQGKENEHPLIPASERKPAATPERLATPSQPFTPYNSRPLPPRPRSTRLAEMRARKSIRGCATQVAKPKTKTTTRKRASESNPNITKKRSFH